MRVSGSVHVTVTPPEVSICEWTGCAMSGVRFKKEDAVVEVEAALAKARGLFHATDPGSDVPVKIEALLPAERSVGSALKWRVPQRPTSMGGAGAG